LDTLIVSFKIIETVRLNLALLLDMYFAMTPTYIGGALTLVALRERSFMILLSVLLGAFVLYWTIAELTSH